MNQIKLFPFLVQVRTNLISVSLELATNAHREAFAEAPIDVIRSCCDKLADVADQVPIVKERLDYGLRQSRKGWIMGRDSQGQACVTLSAQMANSV